MVLADPTGELTRLHTAAASTRRRSPRRSSRGCRRPGSPLRIARKTIHRGDVTYIAGCLFRALGVCAHALHAHARRWVVNEKGLIAAAGALPGAPAGFAARAHGLLARVGSTPDELAATLDAAAALVAEVERAVRLIPVARPATAGAPSDHAPDGRLDGQHDRRLSRARLLRTRPPPCPTSPGCRRCRRRRPAARPAAARPSPARPSGRPRSGTAARTSAPRAPPDGLDAACPPTPGAPARRPAADHRALGHGVARLRASPRPTPASRRRPSRAAPQRATAARGTGTAGTGCATGAGPLDTTRPTRVPDCHLRARAAGCC